MRRPQKSNRWKTRLGLAAAIGAVAFGVVFLIGEFRQRGLPPRPDIDRLPSSFAAELKATEARLTRLFPDGGAWLELGALYLANGYRNEAAQAFARSLENASESHSKVEYYLGLIAQEEGDLALAAKRFEAALAGAPALVPARLRLAEALAKLGDSAAEDAYRKALETGPNRDAAAVGLSGALLMNGKREEAEEIVFAALSASPDSVRLARSAIRIWERSGDAARAQDFRDSVKNRHDPPLEDAWAEELLESRFDTHALGLDFENYFKAMQVKKAFLVLDRIQKIDPQSSRSRFLRGYALSELGDFQAAAKQFEEALRLGADSAKIYASLATCCLELGDLRGAESAARKGLEKEPRFLSLKVVLGRVHLTDGSPALAVERLGEALELDPANEEALRLAAQAYAEVGRDAEALRCLEALEEQNPSDPSVPRMLGQLHIGKGNFPVAVRWLERAFELDSGDVSTLETLALAYLRQGNYEASQGQEAAAIAAYERSIETAPARMEAYVNLAKLNLKLGRDALAEKAFERLLAACSRNAHAYLIYGDYLKSRGQLVEAVEKWTIATQLAQASGDEAVARSLELRFDGKERPQ